MTATARLGYPTVRERALDFGCGVGRLTRAMARFFDEVVGVDISAGMIARARELNHDVTNCQFVDLPEGDLRMFPEHQFDMVYSTLVLQHIPDRAGIRASIADLVRVLRDHGLLVFQLPEWISAVHRLQPRRRLYHVLRRLGLSPAFLYRRLRLSPIAMNYLARREVMELLESLGARVLEVRAIAPQSNAYYVTK